MAASVALGFEIEDDIGIDDAIEFHRAMVCAERTSISLEAAGVPLDNRTNLPVAQKRGSQSNKHRSDG